MLAGGPNHLWGRGFAISGSTEYPPAIAADYKLRRGRGTSGSGAKGFGGQEMRRSC